MIIGPFCQVITLRSMPMKGPLNDDQLEIIANGGVLVSNGIIEAVDNFEDLRRSHPAEPVERVDEPSVLLPGFVDCHTHICYGGTRNNDYALRIAGSSYLDIAKVGGGIWSSVMQTRSATAGVLVEGLVNRISRHVQEGVTTIEIKSGYGLDAASEIKMLQAIKQASAKTPATIIPTCLAAHTKPRDFVGDHASYLQHVVDEILPVVMLQQLSGRVDIFVEETAFSIKESAAYLQQCKGLGFDITVHADQFTAGSSRLAVEMGALSADHLEASGETEIALLAASDTVAVVLPGASMGLGMAYAPARKLLDAGACLAISTDWNPGSAPMGDLLMQSAVMGAAEKLSTSETFAGITYRAAAALRLYDRGVIDVGKKADMQAYATNDYRDILYFQGKMKPSKVWC